LSSRPPDPLEIFIDCSLGRKIAEPLKAAGAVVHLHHDYFDEGAEDEVWLTEVGRRGWVVLTKDKKIRYRTIERDALLNAGLRAFFFMSGNIPFSEMAKIIADALPRIRKHSANTAAQLIAGI
jgi:predicted nuclease of predicted toxin-antitoxin system